MSVVTETFDAILFDMDGTLVDSTEGVIGAWNAFKITYPHLVVEAARFEQEIVNSSRKDGKEGIVALPGVRGITESLLSSEDSRNRWALCTSATRVYATAALQIAGIPTPNNFIAAEDVHNGKPAPDPYVEGAKLCGVDPKRCLVVEDAPAGIYSGQAAGCKTLAVITSHTREVMIQAKPDYLVRNLSR
ncbi:hypothetical protein EW145_g465 [Phellinidium pouzarii]|uniref:Phosphatase n=1 Tax=Phellinidium pouzarii TaxID=167371 RepID=A0A4S4LIW5_9AGAM|nr:hypothetical protein EW145_g465 [Phellinidium pouzarii]